MLPALLEESAATSPLVRMRKGLATGAVVSLCIPVLAACGGGERQDENEPEGEFPVEIVSAQVPTKQRLAQTSELRLTVANVGDEEIPDLAVTVFTAADVEAEGEADAESADPEAGADADSEQPLDEAVEEALREELEDAEAEDTEGEAEGASTDSDLPEARGAFSVINEQPDLAIPSRPVWILEQGYPRAADEEPGPAPPGEVSGSGGAEAAQTNTFSFGALEPNATIELVWRVTPVQPGAYTVRYRIAAGLHGKAVAVNQDGSKPEGEFVVRISDVPPQTRVDDQGNVVEIDPEDIIGQAGSEEQQGELGN